MALPLPAVRTYSAAGSTVSSQVVTECRKLLTITVNATARLSEATTPLTATYVRNHSTERITTMGWFDSSEAKARDKARRDAKAARNAPKGGGKVWHDCGHPNRDGCDCATPMR